MDDDLAALKTTLLRILILTVKPSLIDVGERDEARRQQSLKRASWRSSADQLNLEMEMETENRVDLFLHTLFEVGILSESLFLGLLQTVSEDVATLHAFVPLMASEDASARNSHVYHVFYDSHRTAASQHHVAVPSYPSERITAKLLELQQRKTLTADEYVRLHRRCVANSPALQFVFTAYARDGKEEDLVEMLKLADSMFLRLRPTCSSFSNPSHAAILAHMEKERLLNAEELEWVKQAYCQGSEVVQSAFSLCAETGDVAGLVSMLRSVIEMVRNYETAIETQEFIGELVKELLNEESLSPSQAAVLSALLEKPAPCLCELYKEYKQSGDFEGLLSALLYLSSSDPLVNEELQGEEVDEMEVASQDDGDMSLPSRDDVIAVIKSVRGLLSSKDEETSLRLAEEGNIDVICAVGIGGWDDG